MVDPAAEQELQLFRVLEGGGPAYRCLGSGSRPFSARPAPRSSKAEETEWLVGGGRTRGWALTSNSVHAWVAGRVCPGPVSGKTNPAAPCLGCPYRPRGVLWRRSYRASSEDGGFSAGSPLQ